MSRSRHCRVGAHEFARRTRCWVLAWCALMTFDSSAAVVTGVRLASEANDAPLLVIQGVNLQRAGRINDAESKFRKALEMDPDNALARGYLRRLGRSITNLIAHWPEEISRPLPTDWEKTVNESSVQSDGMVMESYRIEPSIVGSAIQEILAQPQAGAGGTVQQTTILPGSGDLNAASIQLYLDRAGVPIQPPKFLSYDPFDRVILVHAEAADHLAIRRLLDSLNMFPPPQLMVHATLLEISDATARKLNLAQCLRIYSKDLRTDTLPNLAAGSSAVTACGGLEKDMAELISKTLEDEPGVTVVHLPKATVTAGRQLQVKSVETRSFVTAAAAVGQSGAANSTPTTEPFEMGVVVDLVPLLDDDSGRLQITAVATVREVAGYEGAAPEPGDAPAGQGPAMFRVRQLIGRASGIIGDAIFLSGGSTEWRRAGGASSGREPSGVAAGERVTKGGGSVLLLILTSTPVDGTKPWHRGRLSYDLGHRYHLTR